MGSPEKACRVALEHHQDRLSKLKNVVGLGIVQAGDEAPGQGEDDDLAVAIYVEQKQPEADLEAADVIPEMLEAVNTAGEKVMVKTKVIQQGKVVKEEPGLEELPSLGKEPL